MAVEFHNKAVGNVEYKVFRCDCTGEYPGGWSSNRVRYKQALVY